MIISMQERKVNLSPESQSENCDRCDYRLNNVSVSDTTKQECLIPYVWECFVLKQLKDI